MHCNLFKTIVNWVRFAKQLYTVRPSGTATGWVGILRLGSGRSNGALPAACCLVVWT